MGSVFITSSAAPWGQDGAGAGCRAGFQSGQRGSPCQQPLGMDTRMDVCWEDVELLGVRPGCGCCRAWGYREGVGAARPPKCLYGTAGVRGAAHRARSCLCFVCPSCWPRRSCWQRHTVGTHPLTPPWCGARCQRLTALCSRVPGAVGTGVPWFLATSDPSAVYLGAGLFPALSSLPLTAEFCTVCVG